MIGVESCDLKKTRPKLALCTNNFWPIMTWEGHLGCTNRDGASEHIRTMSQNAATHPSSRTARAGHRSQMLVSTLGVLGNAPEAYKNPLERCPNHGFVNTGDAWNGLYILSFQNVQIHLGSSSQKFGAEWSVGKIPNNCLPYCSLTHASWTFGHEKPAWNGPK